MLPARIIVEYYIVSARKVEQIGSAPFPCLQIWFPLEQDHYQKVDVVQQRMCSPTKVQTQPEGHTTLSFSFVFYVVLFKVFVRYLQRIILDLCEVFSHLRS